MPSIQVLSSRLPNSRLLTDPDITKAYARDQAATVHAGTPAGVLLAHSVEDVSTALKWATENGVTVVPRGAGTGLAGGAAALDDCLVISTARMDSIMSLSAIDRMAVVGAGVIGADLDRAAAEVGLMYAPDPGSFTTSTIGGNLATNAGGFRCVKYGVTRDSVLGLEVVLADGRVLHTGSSAIKNVTGLDLTGLFVGSEGTLGIITSAVMKLRPRPRHAIVTTVGTFPSFKSAGDAVAKIVGHGIVPSILELIDGPTLRAISEWKHMELDSGAVVMLIAQTDDADAMDVAEEIRSHFNAAGADFAEISQDAAEADQLLEIRRLAYPAAERLGTCLVEDVGVPRSNLPRLLEHIEAAGQMFGVHIMTVAHAGDGNVHPTFVFQPEQDGSVPERVWQAADSIFRLALDLGGTLTGEHGVGVLKQRWVNLQLGESSMQVHRSIKAALDPLGILNPGKAY
ncbi:FAD-binding oxidoreductase [Actinacidiphila soli]|uniref:FAD-binding oxidoreductase n=1 Tax=Actinacidiphila soli TaxID=2487275 RepID=UPI001F0C3CEA|nr:FAD-linked oxidase C-terminal domain-containing protein [Actinacidiphila soli]